MVVVVLEIFFKNIVRIYLVNAELALTGSQGSSPPIEKVQYAPHT